MKNYILIGLVVVALYLIFFRKQKETAQDPAQPAGPIDTAKQNIEDLQKAVAQKIPELKETTQPIVAQAQQIIESFKAEMQAIETIKQQKQIPVLLDSTEVAPDAMAPKHKFYTVNPTKYSKDTKINALPVYHGLAPANPAV